MPAVRYVNVYEHPTGPTGQHLGGKAPTRYESDAAARMMRLHGRRVLYRWVVRPRLRWEDMS